MKTILNIIFIFLSFYLNAQNVYYKTFEGVLLTEENYLSNMKGIEERVDLAGRVYEIPIKTEIRQDSIIKHVKFEFITFAWTENGQKYDPYGVQRKMIGQHFPIESFKDKNDVYFSEDHLKGKPTLVNFWFTDCPPCIGEIPDLYNLKKEFGDSVNFVAITFEGKKSVERFLEKYSSFNYFHITNATKPINKMKIRAYPVTFLLNENGEIVNVYGDLTFHSSKLREILLMLL